MPALPRAGALVWLVCLFSLCGGALDTADGRSSATLNEWSILPPHVSTSRDTAVNRGAFGVSLNNTHFLVHGGDHAMGDCMCDTVVYRYAYGIVARAQQRVTKAGSEGQETCLARWTRCGHVMTTIQDPKTGRVLVYMVGGRVGSNADNYKEPLEPGAFVEGADVLDPTDREFAWRQYRHRGPIPAPRAFMAHHETPEYLYIHGGSVTQYAKGRLTDTGVYSDLWRLDRRTVEWEMLFMEPKADPGNLSGPDSRPGWNDESIRVWGHVMAVHEQKNAVFTFGGCTVPVLQFSLDCLVAGHETNWTMSKKSVTSRTKKFKMDTGEWFTIGTGGTRPPPLFRHHAVPSVDGTTFTVIGGARANAMDGTNLWPPAQADYLHTFNMTARRWGRRPLTRIGDDSVALNTREVAPRIVDAMVMRLGCEYRVHDVTDNECIYVISGGVKPNPDGDTYFAGNLKYYPTVHVLNDLNWDVAIASQHLMRSHAVTSLVTGVIALVGGGQNVMIDDTPYAMRPGTLRDVMLIDVASQTWHFVRPAIRYNNMGLSYMEEMARVVVDNRPGTDGFFISNDQYMMYYNFTDGHLDTRLRRAPCASSLLVMYERDGIFRMMSTSGIATLPAPSVNCDHVFEVEIGAGPNGWPGYRPEWRDVTAEVEGADLVRDTAGSWADVQLVGGDWFIMFTEVLALDEHDAPASYGLSMVRFRSDQRRFTTVEPPGIVFGGWELESNPFNIVPLYDDWLFVVAPVTGTNMTEHDRASGGIPTEEVIFNTRSEQWTRIQSRTRIGAHDTHRQYGGAAMAPCVQGGRVFLHQVDMRELSDPIAALHRSSERRRHTRLHHNTTVCSVGGSMTMDADMPLLYHVFRSSEIETITPGCNPGYFVVVWRGRDRNGPVYRDCVPCPIGKYLSKPAPQCTQCPPGTSTRQGSSKSIDACSICAQNQCNGASCAVVEGVPHCYCSVFYSGKRCQQPVWLYVLLPSIIVVTIAMLLCHWVRQIRRRTLANLSRMRAAGRMDEAKRVRGEWEIDPRQIDIVSRLGAGASGVVYLGKWYRKKVAVKEFHGVDDDVFVEEMDHLIRLHHPNIIRAEGYCFNPPYLITEFAELGSLDTHLHGDKPMDAKRKKRFVLDIARGVDYLHGLDPPVLHRDLKPANVVISSDDTAKLCDFGIARKAELDRTMTMGMGTASYTAPEVHFKRPDPEATLIADQTRGSSNTSSNDSSLGQPYGTQADVFSFGVLLWEILTEEVPFAQHQWSSRIVQDIIAGIRPPIPGYLIGTEMESLLQECWHGEPAARPTFRDIVRRLQDDTIWRPVMDLGTGCPVSEGSMGAWSASGNVVSAVPRLLRWVDTKVEPTTGDGYHPLTS